MRQDPALIQKACTDSKDVHRQSEAGTNCRQKPCTGPGRLKAAPAL